MCNCQYYHNFYDKRVYYDEQTNTDYYPYIFSKCFALNDETGFAKKEEIDKLIKAIDSGKKSLIDKIPIHPECKIKLVNFIAGKSSNILGKNPNQFIMQQYYYVDSVEGIKEMMEVYGNSLSRDTSFIDIENGTELINTIINALNKYDTNTMPTINGLITPKTLFRGNWEGELYGPYISQFLYLPFKYGNILIDQKYFVEQDVVNTMKMNGWFDIQHGIETGQNVANNNLKYVYNPRVLGSLVHNDPLFQLFYNACLIAIQNGVKSSGYYNDVIDCWTTGGFPDIFASVAHVAVGALRVAWYNKWSVGLKIRPEVFAQRINQSHIKDDDFVNSVPGLATIKDLSNVGKEILDLIREHNKEQCGEENLLLPGLYNECSPTHPSCPSGHAAVAGACCTVMKAMFITHDDDLNRLKWTSPVKHSVDGDNLVDYDKDTSEMTIVGEIHKLASNVSLGRDFAGVHYRNDGVTGNLLGEQYAISYLIDKTKEYYESNNNMFHGYILEKFDGSIIRIDKYGEHELKQ
jgi:hypothetical protein